MLQRGIFWLGCCLGLTVLVSGQACEDVPVHDVTKSFAIEVSQITEKQGKIELDFLWVIDNSASMSGEQYALSKSFGEFVEKLEKYLANIDIRLAVTTTDAITNAGKFMNTPAKDYPPAAFETMKYACLGNEDCVKKYGKGWECKAYPASQMYNLNRSINSFCIFRCASDADCCGEFCFEDECGSDQSCLKDQCSDAPNAGCTFDCKQPGGGMSNSGCLRPPDTKDCPSSLPKFLTMNTLDRFKCNALLEPQQSYQANIEQGLKAAWLALDPVGPNPEQVKSFLRKDAYLVVVFVTDEDDCSIDSRFASPNFTCSEDKDCPGYQGGQAVCKTDMHYSQMSGKQIKLCHGIVKKDYYNSCSLLGDYLGEAHHNCAYDMGCKDCASDDDCGYGWYCKSGKCRPYIYGLPNIATFQNPPGTPIYALTPVAEFYSRLRSLKSDPAKVLVAAIIGDGMPVGEGTKTNKEEPSLISNACMEDAKLKKCQAFKGIKEKAAADCIKDPDTEGCEDYRQAKLECVRECYIASKGDPQSPTMAKNSYICLSPYGQADFGSRYVQIAEMFGPNGRVANLCGEAGIVPALETIAELIIRRVTKICLPMELKEGETLVVTMTKVNKDGSIETIPLVQGDAEEGGDYKIESPTQSCCFPDDKGNCTGTLKAITFNNVLDPEASIEVRYEAQVGGAAE